MKTKSKTNFNSYLERICFLNER